MIKLTGLVILLLVASVAVGQEVAPALFKIGLYGNTGVGGMGNTMSTHHHDQSSLRIGIFPPTQRYTEHLGGGISLTAPIHPRWALVGNFGYMYQGTYYREYYNYRYFITSSYRQSSIDVWVLGQYNNVSAGPVRFTAAFGFAQSTLISATHETSTGRRHITSELPRSDLGLALGPGMELSLTQGAIQTRLLYVVGFTDNYSSMNNYSRMHHTSNGAFLLQLGYLFN